MLLLFLLLLFHISVEGTIQIALEFGSKTLDEQSICFALCQYHPWLLGIEFLFKLSMIVLISKTSYIGKFISVPNENLIIGDVFIPIRPQWCRKPSVFSHKFWKPDPRPVPKPKSVVHPLDLFQQDLKWFQREMGSISKQWKLSRDSIRIQSRISHSNFEPHFAIEVDSPTLIKVE